MHSVAAFYRFAPISDPLAERDRLLGRLTALDLRGSVILAREGVNGTLAGAGPELSMGLAAITAMVGELRINRSEAETAPFRRLRVKVKREIVTMGDPTVDPGKVVGTHVGPREWNALVASPGVVLIDTRNTYEVGVGTFADAVDPGIARFSDFPSWWKANAAAFAGKRVAMFCTGGIRCEKATSFALQNGATEVFHLDGGILRYLQEIPDTESRWQGECFVFDERVAVGACCAEGATRMCRQCGRPVPEPAESGAAAADCHWCADT